MSFDTSVAIVGLGGVFPEAPDPLALWKIVCEGRNTSSEPPQGRWNLSIEDAYNPQVGALDKVYSRKACFIRQLPELPAGLRARFRDDEFPRDPLYHLLLSAGHQAYASAKTEGVNPDRVGVILGNLALPSERSSHLTRRYFQALFEEQLFNRPFAGPQDVHPLDRYVTGLPAGILSRALGLGGPCYTLDAACASSLYAIKLAVDELRSGRLDTVLTGGVSRPDPLFTQMGFSQLRALSPSGVCAPFDRAGNGLVVGEGAGVLVLKRTADAVRDGDQILAVIRGIGLSNDIAGNLLAPASEGQLRAMQAAYRNAGWQASSVDLIECHATGTPVGDAVEFSSLVQLWEGQSRPGNPCVIGSVKSNIGHLLTAAGSAAVTKTLLALRHKTLPPTANFSSPQDKVQLDDSPFDILSQPQDWKAPKDGGPRRAGVSAFGFGGINAHLLLEEWREPVAHSKSKRPAPSKPEPVAVVGLEVNYGPWEDKKAFAAHALGVEENPASAPSSQSWGIETKLGLKNSGYFLKDVSTQPGTFRIPPAEMAEMLPRQLLMLQVAAGALEDAGLKDAEHLNTGVFIGTGLDLNATNFAFRWDLANLAPLWLKEQKRTLPADQLTAWIEALRSAAGPPLTANRVMGALGSIVASRIAKEFRVGGPSFTISSEETSGVKALEIAVRALQDGSLRQALVGAVDLSGDFRNLLQRGLLANDPQLAQLPAGEGAVALVLKPLAAARQDGDRVYAVIQGIGSANSGTIGTCQVEDSAYLRSLAKGINETRATLASVQHIELLSARLNDGNGELKCLESALGTAELTGPISLGTSRSSLGHADAASGLIAVSKGILALASKTIPGQIEGKSSSLSQRFYIPELPHHWLRNKVVGPRRALVATASVDGNCSHVLLEEGASDQLLPLISYPREEALFCCEGNTTGDLAEQLRELNQIASTQSISLQDLSKGWLNTQPQQPNASFGLALVASDRQQLVELIRLAVEQLDDVDGVRLPNLASNRIPTWARDRIFFAAQPFAAKETLAFVYPGSGNHFAGMGRDLALMWPGIFLTQDKNNKKLREQYRPNLFWNNNISAGTDDNHNALVIGQVALGTAVSDVVHSLGISPGKVIGYSLGESAGLFSSGAWQDRDGMLERLNASDLFTEKLAGSCQAAREVWNLPADEEVDWQLGVVNAPADDVRAAINGHQRVYLLIINSPSECVIGGQRPQVEQVVTALNCHFFPLRGVTTVHCEVLKPVAAPYRELHSFPTTPPEGVRFYSGGRKEGFTPSRDVVADAILTQASDTIDYTQLINQAYQDGARVFLEMGPGNSCTRMINRILGDRPHRARAICHPGADIQGAILRCAALCVAERLPVDLSRLSVLDEAVEKPVKQASGAGKVIAPSIGGQPFTVPAMPAGQQQPSPPVPQAEPVTPPPEALLHDVSPQSVESNAEPDWLADMNAILTRQQEAHAAFLSFSAQLSETMAKTVSWQQSLLGQADTSALVFDKQPVQSVPSKPTVSAPARLLAPRRPDLFMDRDQCMEFAIGSIAKVLGSAFADADTFPSRVRLPDEPLMLVDRITEVEGEPCSMTHGRVVTEHDVYAERWYLDGNRIPTAIAVEAGQADLFLSGYLGIDLTTRGQAVYRLLDAVVTFHRGLPQPGDVIRYDIKIEHFFRQDQTYLFRFQFDGTVNGQPLLTMRKGCAGFFTEAELAAGKGIVHTKLDLMPQPGKRPDDWHDPLPMTMERYNEDQINALYRGDLASCFGSRFAALPWPAYTLPGGHLKLVDRVTQLDPNGGRFGIGLIRAEMDIDPQDWFLTCHFCDDHVMPGTLMYECCLHTLRIYLMRMGWVGPAGTTVCEPVAGVASQLKCRGQVTQHTRRVTYEVTLKEIGYRPEPFAIVDALMYADDKPIVQITDMTVQCSGLDRAAIENLWQTQSAHDVGPKPAIFDYDKILAFSNGKPSEAFGEPYRVFDEERIIARLPRPPFQFLDRITAIVAEQWRMVAGGTIEAQYDVPVDAWYFGANRQAEMPFAVLLEIALQPCGWFAAYMGSALTSPNDLSFRNLDGNAIKHRPVTAESGTLTIKVKSTRVSQSGGMIIQGYDFQVHDEHGPVYTGDTVFGYFSKQALANQVGLRDVAPYQPDAAELARACSFPYPQELPFPDTQMRMVDNISAWIPDGGPQGLGFIRGSKLVDPDEWFFAAHFYQDPVCPGSLGLESFFQLLKVVAAERWEGNEQSNFVCIVPEQPHHWTYRGQIIPTNKEVTIEAVITSVDDQAKTLTADGFLLVDGKIIYGMKDFTLAIEP